MPNMKNPIVQTQNGQLRGVVKRSCEGFDYCAFLGVPYAKPPIGDLRFQDPQPCEKWSGIRDAKEYGNKCYQYDVVLRTLNGSEDCLNLNVFVRSLENVHIKKPVMVWIHGGGYLFGSGTDEHFGPDYLLQKDIVLVTFNYRLGVFGFLNLEHELAPGNQGLKDQIMVLRWVQENIENFGGDPNNVTIFGESVGGICIHYLTLSPLAKGLFHKAISQSGVGHNTWARLRNPKPPIYKLCHILNKYFQDPKAIVTFLKTVDSYRLIRAQEQLRRSYDRINRMYFGPGVDDKSETPVMPIPIEKAALEGVHVPYLLGYNNLDGAQHLIDPISFLGYNIQVYDEIDRNFTKWICPGVQDVLDKYNLTPNDLKRMYFKDGKISHFNRVKFLDLTSDIHFVEGIHKTIKIQAEKSTSPTYVYKFTYDERLTLTKAMLQFPISGACHFDEVEYLFCAELRTRIGLEPFKKGTPRYKLMERMVEMWTNFATYGSPTPTTSDLIPVEWLPNNDGTDIRYLNIDKDLQMKTMKNIEEKFSSVKNIKKL